MRDNDRLYDVMQEKEVSEDGVEMTIER